MLFDLSQDIGEVYNVAAKHAYERRNRYDQSMEQFNGIGTRISWPIGDNAQSAYKYEKAPGQRVLWGPFEGEHPLEEDEEQSTPSL